MKKKIDIQDFMSIISKWKSSCVMKSEQIAAFPTSLLLPIKK